MAVGYLLAALESLLAHLPQVLQSHGISCTQTKESTVGDGWRTTDVVLYECVDGSATVELCVGKRRERDYGDIVLMPSRRIFFLKHNASDELAERINAALLDNGADDSP